MTLLASACSSGGMQTAPRLEAPSNSEEPDTPPLDTREPDPEPVLPQASAALLLRCTNDDVRVCTYYLPEHNGVRQCVVGYQVCSDNDWGQCLEAVAVDGGAAREPGGSF